MRPRALCLPGLLAVLSVFAAWPAEAQAGMPSPVLTDWAALRLEGISFFLVAFFLAAAVVRWLWNALAGDFPLLPRLTYLRALAGVALWSILLVVVLTMIAGSRELLTPGAWQKQGLLYSVGAAQQGAASQPAAESPQSAAELARRLEERRAHLRELRDALWRYAKEHGGRLPADEADPDLAPALWEMPGAWGMRYLYVHGKTAGASADVLVYEPQFDGDDRVVLQADGQITALSSAELRRRIETEGRP